MYYPFASFVVLALVALAPATAAEVTATRLDGTAIAGELRGWDENEVTLATSAGEERIAAKDLLSLAWSAAPDGESSDENTTGAQIELVDGSILPIAEFQCDKGKAEVTLPGPLPSDEKSLTFSTKELVAVQLQPLKSEAATQWQEIRDLKSAGDVLVLLKRDGKTLDYVEGVLGPVSADKIEFKMDGDSVRANRDKVAGFIYYRGQDKPDDKSRLQMQGRSGLRANVRRAELNDSIVELTTAGGTKLQWPLDDITFVDFSAGKLLYLSDIAPATQRWTPLVGLPGELKLAAQYGAPRRNQSAFGGLLALAANDGSVVSPTSQLQTYNKGLAIRSRTELAYRLPAGFQKFTAVAGIDPTTSASGTVKLQIFGDDRPLLDTNVDGSEPPKPIDLDIEGVKRLRIVVDFGPNLDAGDWLNLCDAKIIK